MIGVDIVKINRFANKSDYFARRILSNRELNYYNQQIDIDSKTRVLASIWAIKEAIFKADNQNASFQKIELEHTDKGWKSQNFDISISHDEDAGILIAFVIKKR